MNYPTKWQGGKRAGGIRDLDPEKAFLARITLPKSAKDKGSLRFSFKNADDKKEAYTKADKWLWEMSEKYKLVVNKYRFTDDQTIEVDAQGTTFFTDSKHIDIVQKHTLGTKEKKEKDNIRRTYVVYSIGKSDSDSGKKERPQFTKLISNSTIINYKDGNTLNLRGSNIGELGEVPTEYINNEKDYKVNHYEMLNSTFEIRVKHNGNTFNSIIIPYNYPQKKWILGKLENSGTNFVRNDGKNKYTIVAHSIKTGKSHTKTIDISDFDTMESAKMRADKIKYDMSYRLGIVKNMIKIENDEIMQVTIGNKLIMITDKVLLPLIQKIILCMSRGGSKSDNAKYYVATSIGNKVLSFHNLITSYNMTDHINHNPLDNRFINLRWTNPSENNKNKEGVTGVSSESDCYVAKVKSNGKEECKKFYIKDFNDDRAITKATTEIFRKNIYEININSSGLEFTGHENIYDLTYLLNYLKTTKGNLLNNVNFDISTYLQGIDITPNEKQKIHDKYVAIELWRSYNLDRKIKIVVDQISKLKTKTFSKCIVTCSNTIHYDTTYKFLNYDQCKVMYEDICDNDLEEDTIINQPVKLDFKKIEDIVDLKNGKLLPEQNNIIAKTDIVNIQCDKLHSFCHTYDDLLKGKWCQKCEIVVGTLKVREVCGEIFTEKFGKAKFNSANYPNFSLCLEWYCESLKIAFDYNGEDCFKYSPTFHNTKEDFEKTKLYNSMKKEVCEEKGINLIIVPYTINHDYIKDYISEQFELVNLNCDKPVKTKNENYFLAVKTIVEQRGGSTVSDCYVGAKIVMKFKCNNGHEFEVAPNNIQKGRWCPTCNIKQSEMYMWEIVNYILEDYIFKKVRPSWLKNKEGNKLELDMYCEDIKLAFEYNGEQHYKFIEHFHRTEENFKKRQEDDKIKVELCKANNIKLIVIPYTVKHEDFYDFVLKQLKVHKVEFEEPDEPIDISKIKINNPQMKKVTDIISKKDGKLIEGTYITRQSQITLKCNKGHTWTTKMGKIISGGWCHTCGLEVEDDTKEKISDTLKKFNKTDEGKKLKKKSLEKRSKTMAGAKEQRIKATTHKKCKTCGVDKPASEYSKKTDAGDGLQTNCKKCAIEIKNKKKKNN